MGGGGGGGLGWGMVWWGGRWGWRTGMENWTTTRTRCEKLIDTYFGQTLYIYLQVFRAGREGM